MTVSFYAKYFLWVNISNWICLPIKWSDSSVTEVPTTSARSSGRKAWLVSILTTYSLQYLAGEASKEDGVQHEELLWHILLYWLLLYKTIKFIGRIEGHHQGDACGEGWPDGSCYWRWESRCTSWTPGTSLECQWRSAREGWAPYSDVHHGDIWYVATKANNLKIDLTHTQSARQQCCVATLVARDSILGQLVRGQSVVVGGSFRAR